MTTLTVKPATQPKRPRDARSISIPGHAVKTFLQKKQLKQVELAHLLGVNPATLSRWGSPNDDMPTSTTFLVLMPLLLSAGVELMPAYYPEIVNREFGSVFGQQELKKNAEKLKQLARERFMRTNPDLLRSRKLFEALQEAWGELDASTKTK